MTVEAILSSCYSHMCCPLQAVWFVWGARRRGACRSAGRFHRRSCRTYRLCHDKSCGRRRSTEGTLRYAEEGGRIQVPDGRLDSGESDLVSVICHVKITMTSTVQPPCN